MRNIIFFYLVVIPVLLTGQNKWVLKPHTKDHVFKQAITELAIDSIGYIWFGSSDGAIKYDGHSYKHYRNEGAGTNMLKANTVYDILSLPDSTIWVSTSGGGISMYQPKSNEFKTILTDNHPKTIHEDRITNMHLLSGDSILIHYRGIDNASGGFTLLDHDGKLLNHHFYDKDLVDKHFVQFSGIAHDKSNIWIAAESLYNIDRATMNHTIIEYPFSVKGWDDVKAMEYIDDNQILIGTSKGCFKYDISAKEWSSFLIDEYIKRLYTYQNRIMIMTNKKIYSYHKKDEKLVNLLDISKEYEQTGLRLYDIMVHKNKIWLATKIGVFKQELEEQIVQTHTYYSDSALKMNGLRSLGNDSLGSIYTDRQGQIMKRTTDKEMTLINKTGSAIHGQIVDFINKGNHLLATKKGIFQYQEKNNTLTKLAKKSLLNQSIKDQEIWSIYNNKLDSVLWIGTRTKGLYKYDLSQDTFINFRHNPNNNASLCYDRYLFRITPGIDGNLWISTDKGISVINPTTNEFLQYPTVMNPLKKYIVHHLIASEKYMWIGTRDHGLYRYDIKNDQLKVYTIQDGLPFTGVNRVIFDNGLLFFSTTKGVCTLDIATDQISTFDESDGIAHNGLYYCHLFSDNEFLNVSSGNSNIIYRIPKTHIGIGKKLNNIILKSFQSTYSDSINTTYNPRSSLFLTAEQNNFSINYTTIDFDQKNIKYRYQLLGYDDRWNYDNTKQARYSHVPGGEYQFLIQSSVAGGAWGRDTHLDISLAHFWYKTWWFYALCLFVALSFIGYVYKQSIDRLKLEKAYQIMLSNAELKALRAQMNPHFLFNSLNSIKSFIVENDRRNASNYLNKFAKLIRLILNHSKSDMIPLTEEVHAIQLYVDMEKVRFDSFEFNISIDPQIDTEVINVPPMIIQPYLENAIWHGLQHKREGNNDLYISIESISSKLLEVVIRDNGIGRDAAAKKKSKSALGYKSYGMSITKERLQTICRETDEIHVIINDLYDNDKPQGTEIRIKLPYLLSDQE